METGLPQRDAMSRACAVAIAALLFSAAAATAQTAGAAIAQYAAPGLSAAPLSAAPLVDFHLFLKTHPAFTFHADQFTPAEYAYGQVPYYGGPLQYYLNVERTYPLHDVKLPFGASFFHPAAHGRVEIFGSVSGLYVPFASIYTRPNSWLTQANAGVRVAVDEERHFWLGGSIGYLANFADQKRQYGYGSVDFTYRFGH